MRRVGRSPNRRSSPVGLLAAAVLVAALAVGWRSCAGRGSDGDADAVTVTDRVSADRGLIRNDDRASDGYTLFEPLLSTTAYLIDRDGRVVHRWATDRAPGVSVYLLDNGHLLRCARETNRPVVQAGGEGGRIQEFGWDGELLWDYVLADERRIQHHDIEPLPNGNVLAIVWERVSRELAIAAGRRPELVPQKGIYPDGVVEIEPDPPRGGRVVWEWHLVDHVIQDVDPARPHFGVVRDHPELVDINGDSETRPPTDDIIDRLRAIGYVIGNPSPRNLESDVMHTNAIAYSQELDQILLSVHRFNEIWVIDHSTTTAEAAGHSGGRSGRGGDLIYRWGNPRVYGRGTPSDQLLFGHHDARWISAGHPGAGNILVFNNGCGRPGGDRSSVDEITPPVTRAGSYRLDPGAAFGPDRARQVYPQRGGGRWSADFLSGAQRLPNGNTFICDGPSGRFFEVTPRGDVVWEYLNPFAGRAPNPAGDPPHSVFRATRIPPDHPGLAGRPLAPLRIDRDD